MAEAAAPDRTRDRVARWLPGVAMVRMYERSWLGRDVGAGLVLTALLVPAGMGYAEAAGLPPVNGLYATMVPLVAYALAGPSRIMVLGPDSSLAPLIAAVVVPVAAGDPGQAVIVGSMLALITGGLCVAAGLARFGFLTDLLSMPVRHGYLNGIALTILIGQLPKLFGFSVDADGVIPEARGFVEGVADSKTVPAALIVGTLSLVVILVLRRWAPRVPGLLVAIVGSILATVAFDLASHGVSLVGDLPQGLPDFAVPTVALDDLGRLSAAAIGIALLSIADTSVLSRTFAARNREPVNEDQELVALGAANVAGGLFQGFPVSSSSSRTPAAAAAGAKSQVTNLVGAAAVLVVLVWLPGLFRNLPSSTLAAIVIASAITLIDVASVVRLARVAPGECVISVVAFLGVALLGVLPGIGLAIGLALLSFLRKAWKPHSVELVRVDGLKGYHDHERHPEGRRIPGLLLFRFDAPLFFANADVFKEQILRLVDSAPEPVRWVVVTAEPITDVDATAGEMLAELRQDLVARGVVLGFAEFKGHARERLARLGEVERIGEDRFFRTIGQAVHAYVAAEGVAWTDWEDDPDQPH